ncbi:hypothetical protein [Prauserella muralis]|uniref:Uncharacterized protein n=1 Tax=Prauserella muralis TaxID=588067 RepID=A0A2V4B0Z7_9PSEU|nr:hypothetical protein [Prauserella muralis]PXY22235.1 hypothetical protein BAY60_20330 [Prauserella muralis]TWE27868.1 hypothetical protein FHX69_0517 [Prauserella muralis]
MTGNEDTTTSTVRVGLLTDPGLPTEVAGTLAGELPGELTERVGGGIAWHVDHRQEPMTLDDDGEVPLARIAQRMRAKHGWDLLLCVTDLPRRVEFRPVVAEVSTRHGIALASLPAVGAIRLRPHLCDTLVRLVAELRERGGGRPRGTARGLFAPARWLDNPDADIDASLALVGVRGRLRLLFGMVRDNRPWRLVPQLSSAFAAAVATGAFGVFFNSIWTMADALSGWRLALVNLLAATAMVTWVTGYNGLWERPLGTEARARAALYNAATITTVLLGVACMYAVLFTATTLAALAVITPPYFEQTLGHPVGFGDYLQLAWLASSMGTVAGALGSSLESADAVRQATYSRRERERRERLAEQEREEKETGEYE